MAARVGVFVEQGGDFRAKRVVSGLQWRSAMRRPVMLNLALLGLLACVDEAEPACELDLVAVIELGEEVEDVCATTASGRIVLDTVDGVVVARLDADNRLQTLTRVDGEHTSCVGVAEDPSTGHLWLGLRHGAIDGVEYELLELDSSGLALRREVLVADAGEVRLGGLGFADDHLYLGGLVEEAVESREGGSLAHGLLEARDRSGAVVWRRLDYYGSNPAPEYSGQGFEGFAELVADTSGVVAFAYEFGIDSAQISLLSVSVHDGDVRWVDLVVGDDYYGPNPRLGGDGQGRLFLAEEQQPRYLFDDHWFVIGVERPGQSIVSALWARGGTAWRTPVELPGWHEVAVSNPVPLGPGVDEDGRWDPASVEVVASGRNDEGEFEASLIRYDADGVYACRRALFGPQLRSLESLQLLDDRRRVIAGIRDDGEHREPVLVVLAE